MTQITDQIMIYKFNGLTKLKNNDDYSDHLVILYGKDKGVWYQYPEEQMTLSDKQYIESTLGISEGQLLEELIYCLNEAITNKLYKKLTLKKLSRNKNSSTAETEEGVTITTQSSPTCRGMIWYSQTHSRSKSK